MPGPLKNARHERFAQELAKGKTADDAYEQAGFSANRGNATRLKANESVAQRLSELQGQAAQRTVITVESLTQMLLDDRALAHQIKQPGPAVSAVEKIAKLHGLMIDKKEIRSGNILDDANPDELAKLRELLDGGASSGDPGAGRPSDRPKPH